MAFDKIDRILNIIGQLSIVVSLIFLIVEIQQSQQIAIATQVQARTDAQLFRNNMWLIGEWELGHTITANPYETLAPAEQFARRQMVQWERNLQTNNYFQYRAGLLSEEQWNFTQDRIRDLWSNCSLREFAYNFEVMEQPFVEYLLSLEDPCN